MSNLSESTGKLLDDLIIAKKQSAELMQRQMGVVEEDISVPTDEGSAIYLEAKMTRDAIINFLTEIDFKVTELKAPVFVENLTTPDQAVNVAMETLLGEYGPLLDGIKKIGSLIPGAGEMVEDTLDELKGKIEKVIKPLLEGGATLPGLNLGKDDGGLQCTGYAYVGEDPDTQGSFDVSDEDGQRQFTKVKLIIDDIEE